LRRRTASSASARIRSVERAQRLLDEFSQAELTDPRVDPENRTRWWLQRDATASVVVLLHGFTNTPRQYDVLGEALFADGWSVLAPRFPYHGFRDRRTREIAKLRASDILETTAASVCLAAEMGERIAVLGISVGGTAALWAASTLAIDQAVAVSPFFRIRYLGVLSGPVHQGLEALPNAFLWWDPLHHERDMPPQVYPQFSTHALAEMLHLDAFVKAPGAFHARRAALVLNPNEPLVSNTRARRQCALLERAGLAVQIVSLSGLPAIHDVIEPRLPTTHVERVYPVLRAILRGEGYGRGGAKGAAG